MIIYDYTKKEYVMNKFKSTRGDKREYTAAQGIIAGLADDKGLLVPVELPKNCLDLEHLATLDYQGVAMEVLGKFFDDFTEEEIRHCVYSAYDEKFDTEKVAPLKEAGEAFFLELYHGKTSAFKDMALSILPYLLTTSLKKENEKNKICILTATSGDTGKAALEGFCDVPGTEIIVFYPEDGVSQVQKQQMITQEGANTHVFAIKGNFDDAQTGVKAIFNDNEFGQKLLERGVKLSSANSINIGRLVPQVAYYVSAYCQLVQQGEIKVGDEINVVVPTGNFGNILAAFYAREMGVPIKKFICASNENKVLTDFIRTGVYDTKRDFHLTNSPSMDILISSNLERLLFHLSGGNAAEIAGLMKNLDEKKCYEVSDRIKEGLKAFYGGYATVAETNQAIGAMYQENGYVMDTHTAVAYKVYSDYKAETGDAAPAIIASTASPYKFAESVATSIGVGQEKDGFHYIKALCTKTGNPVPEGLRDLDKKEVRHKGVIEKGQMKDVVLESL